MTVCTAFLLTILPPKYKPELDAQMLNQKNCKANMATQVRQAFRFFESFVTIYAFLMLLNRVAQAEVDEEDADDVSEVADGPVAEAAPISAHMGSTASDAA
jgi:hypothetical protein